MSLCKCSSFFLINPILLPFISSSTQLIKKGLLVNCFLFLGVCLFFESLPPSLSWIDWQYLFPVTFPLGVMLKKQYKEILLFEQYDLHKKRKERLFTIIRPNTSGYSYIIHRHKLSLIIIIKNDIDEWNKHEKVNKPRYFRYLWDFF